MFNLLKKIAAKKQDTRAIIEQIHNEFNIGGEKALMEAKDILSGLHITNEEKANRLLRAGFSQVKEVKEFDQISKKKKMQEGVASALNELSFKYPRYKFITEKMADEICFKYNLVIADISQYTGFVPDKNLRHIEDFYAQENELSTIYYSVNSFRSFGDDRLNELTKAEYERKIAHEEYMDKIYTDGGVPFRERFEHLSYSKRPLKIAAPLKDMNTEGHRLKGNKLKREIPDPVILAPIKVNGTDLYCIVTAWGDEASDEIIVNQKNN